MNRVINRLQANYDLFLSVLIILFGLISSYQNSGMDFTNALSLPLVLFLPGYLLFTLLSPGDSKLHSMEKYVVSIALSIAIAVLLGMILNSTPIGVEANVLLTFLAGICGVLIFMILRQRHNLFQERSKKVGKYEHPLLKPNDVSGLEVLIIGVISFLILSIMAFFLFHERDNVQATQFYVESPSGSYNDLSDINKDQDSLNAIIGLVNLESESRTYEIHRKINTERQVVIATVKLVKGQAWEFSDVFKVPSLKYPFRVTYLLYIDNSPADPYRSLHIWFMLDDTHFKLENGDNS